MKYLRVPAPKGNSANRFKATFSNLIGFFIISCMFFAMAGVAAAVTVNPGESIQAAIGGNTYYVSLSGSDANDGFTEATAWRTITYAATKARAGDTVIIKSGNYGSEKVVMTNSGTSTSPILIKAEVPGEVVLTS